MGVLITGGSGFVGTAIADLLLRRGIRVLNLDKMTYASNPEALAEWEGSARYEVVHGDVSDLDLVLGLFEQFQPDHVVHCAAETQVPGSRETAAEFLQTNFIGTFTMLEAARHWWAGRKGDHRFHQISTDEVYGRRPADAPAPDESTAFAPNTPYAASKAAACHLVRAWGQTYDLDVVTTTCANEYGPWQYPGKPLPRAITCGAEGAPLLVSADEACNVRDWVHVADQAEAMRLVLEHGVTGETYNIGGGGAHSGAEIVRMICRELDARLPENAPHARMIEAAPAGPGMNERLSMDTTKIWWDLRWQPEVDFRTGLSRTVDWYLANRTWWETRRPQVGRDGVLGRQAA